MVLHLIYNVALLVTLAVALQFLSRRFVTGRAAFHVVCGMLFGAVGVVGMMTPMHFAPGVIYDARSVVLCLAGLFGGPVAGALAAVICGVYRALLGGPGMIPGLLVIVEAAVLGTVWHYLRQHDERWIGPWSLWGLGLAVHGLMIGFQLFLPDQQGWAVLRQVGPTVMLFYPLAFLLVAQVFVQGEREIRATRALEESQAELQAMIDCSPLALYSVDRDGTTRTWNESAERIFGWTAAEAIGHRLPLVPDEKQQEFDSLRERVWKGETFTGVELTRQRKDGSLIEVSLAVAPVLGPDGQQLAIFAAMEDITERKRADVELREQEERFRALVEGAPDAIFVQTEGRFVYVNPAGLELFGASSSEELLGQDVMERFHPSVREAVHKRIHRLNVRKQKVEMLEEVYLRLDGSEVPVEVAAVPVAYGGKDGAIVFARDLTARKRLEQQLGQAQKMEAVGRLAGGMAHDFNNMLQAILGYSEILLAEAGEDPRWRDPLEEIRKAGRRSADLTRSLLGFARRQPISPRHLDLNETVPDMLKMLGRLVEESIAIQWLPCRGPCPVLVDPVQIDQVLANLVVNARDAIGGAGRITIETGHAEFDQEYCLSHPGFREGRYEMLAVSDDGCGMDRTTLAQAFDPFFTTKSKDEGTGLGLATVYGIVKQNEGFINIYSEPGRGTTVRIYLPHRPESEERAAERGERNALPTGAETVLLVEDEPTLLALSQRMLDHLGYTVLAAGNPDEALVLARDSANRIDLLMTDVVMPGMSGKDLWNRILEIRPDLPCLFMSGYTDNVIVHHGVLEEGLHFLQKPFTQLALAQKIRDALD